MKIYTKSGDKGQTRLANCDLAFKDDPAVELYGRFDELNSHIGYLLTMMSRKNDDDLFTKIQKQLFAIAANIPFDKDSVQIDYSLEQDLESHIDSLSENLPELKNFILPGGHRAAAYCHVCRVSCRNLERELVGFYKYHNGSQKERVGKVIPIINRLSDYFFTMARAINSAAQIEETKWEGQ